MSTTPRNAVIGELSPDTLALLLANLLVRQKSLQSDVAYAKRNFGEHHEAVGVAMAELAKVTTALGEIIDYGVPRARAAA